MSLQSILGILNILLAFIPNITDSKVASQTVAWLLSVEPTLVQFSEQLKPIISNIVAAFAANPATTATQLAALKVLDAKTDADFDDAISTYLANHPDPVAAPLSSDDVTGDPAAPLTPAG